MQDERWEADVQESFRPLMPRAVPNARFVTDLEQDVRRAARQRMDRLGIQPAVPFEQMVVELRKLVRLLRETLVPLTPEVGYRRQLQGQLQKQSVAVSAQQQSRPQRWLMVGGVVGSVLSVGGLVAALLARRRNGTKDQK
jgi:hypothetical protein